MAKKVIILLAVAMIVLLALNGFFIVALNSDGSSSSGTAKNSRDNGAERIKFSALSVMEDDDNDEFEGEDKAITGSALEQASAAALAYIGEGRVTDSEIGDEEGYYEIEITLNDGSEVDVHLDENFNVLSTEYEDEEDDD